MRNTVASKRLEALSALLPHVSGNLRENNQVLSTAAFGFTGFGGFPTLLGPFSTFDARIVVSAPVFDLSARHGLAAAHADDRAADADYHHVRSTVALAVAHVYLQAVADAARLESTRAQVATAESLVRFATDQNAAGLVARIDVVRHRADLATNLSPMNPLFQERYQGITSALSAQNPSLHDAGVRAMAVLDATVSRQAAMQAYNDAWLLLLISFICVAPAVFLLRKPKPAGSSVTADAH